MNYINWLASKAAKFTNGTTQQPPPAGTVSNAGAHGSSSGKSSPSTSTEKPAPVVRLKKISPAERYFYLVYILWNK